MSISAAEKNITDEIFYKKFERTFQNLTLTGKAPWLIEGKIERDVAFNPNSGVIFKGINALMLEMSSAEKGFKESRWISAKEIENLKLRVRPREEPTPIAYINKHVHPTNVHPSTGKSFSNNNPKQHYYYMYNIEQLKEYEQIRNTGMKIEAALVKDKIETIIQNAKTNNFSEILNMVSEKAQEKSVDDKTKIIAQELARYRTTQEFKGNFIPQTPLLVMKDASIKTHGGNLLNTLYHAENAKERFISNNMSLENDNVRTVARTKQKEKQAGHEI